jgi:hypothetical protein
MDETLKHALDYYIEQASSMLQTGQITGGQGGNAPVDSDVIYAELCDLRDAIERLPPRVFYLDDPDFPYDLQHILRGIPMHALAWRTDSANSSDVGRYRAEVDEIIAKAAQLRGLLQVAQQRAGPGHGLHIALPPGEIRRRTAARP